MVPTKESVSFEIRRDHWIICFDHSEIIRDHVLVSPEQRPSTGCVRNDKNQKRDIFCNPTNATPGRIVLFFACKYLCWQTKAPLPPPRVEQKNTNFVLSNDYSFCVAEGILE